MSQPVVHSIAVRCKCGKKYRVKTMSQEAGVVCADCGHTIRVAAGDLEKPHWTQNVLWMVWAIPVCIAVSGVLYILASELSRRPLSSSSAPTQSANQPTSETATQSAADATSPQTPPTVETASIAETSPAPMNDVEVPLAAPTPMPEADVPSAASAPEYQILFPGSAFPEVKDLGITDVGRHWQRQGSGQFRVSKGELLSTSNERPAILIRPLANDFDLQLSGDFQQKGNMFFMIGWDVETASGYLLYNSGLVQPWPWQVFEFQNGHQDSKPVTLERKLRIRKNGDLLISVHQRQLSIHFSGDQIAKHVPIPDYQPGAIIFGTHPNQYEGKAVFIDKIRFRDLPKDPP